MCHCMRILSRSPWSRYTSSWWHAADHGTTLRDLWSSVHAGHHPLCLPAHVRLTLRHRMAMR